MPRKKKKSNKEDVDTIDEGMARLMEIAEKASKGSTFNVAAKNSDNWRYVDFIDLSKNRPCLPLEYLYGTRGFICGRAVKYDSNEAAGKSSVILMNMAMAQATGGAWTSLWESEKAAPPPDYIYSLGCDPDTLTMHMPDTVSDCVEGMIEFIRTIRDNIDRSKKYPILLAVDSVSGLGANALDIDATDKKSKTSLGYHSRMFSEYFREKFKLCAREDAILFASGQLRANIDTSGMGGGGPKTTTLADTPFAFHISWRVRLSHSSFRDNDGKIIGDMIGMYSKKNKLVGENRSIKVLLRNTDHTPEGETRWDFTQANIDLLFGPRCPFDPQHYKSAGGWYSHSALAGGKSLRREEFVDRFYDHEELVMECRQKLRIRGFGFDFETKYKNRGENVEEATTQPNAD